MWHLLWHPPKYFANEETGSCPSCPRPLYSFSGLLFCEACKRAWPSVCLSVSRCETERAACCTLRGGGHGDALASYGAHGAHRYTTWRCVLPLTLEFSVLRSVPVELNWKWALPSGSDKNVMGWEKLLNHSQWGLRAWALSCFLRRRFMCTTAFVCERLNARGSLQQSTEGKTLWPRETSPRTAGCSDDGPPWQH